MFALMKNGKLIKLTTDAREGANLLARGEIDGMYQVQDLGALAKLLNGSLPPGKPGREARSNLEKLWRQAMAAGNELADHLQKEYQRLESSEYMQKVKAGGKTFLAEMKTAVKKAKAAAQEAGKDKDKGSSN